MLITDGACTIRYVGGALKEVYGISLHDTSNIHAETIPQCYPEVNVLSASIKAVLRKPSNVRT